MKFATTFILVTSLFACRLQGQGLVTEKKTADAFPVVDGSRAAAIYVDDADHWLVQKAASLLQQDIEKVTGRRPEILHRLPVSAQNLTIIGSLDQSPLIGQLCGPPNKYNMGVSPWYWWADDHPLTKN